MMKIFCTSSLKTRIFSGVVLVGLLGASALAVASKKDDTMRFAYDQAPESVDPYFNNVRIGVIIGANVWDTLVYRDPVNNEYKGLLAKSWIKLCWRSAPKLAQSLEY